LHDNLSGADGHDDLIALRQRGEPVGPVVAQGFGFLSDILDQAVAYWHQIRGDSPIPRRDDLVPEQIVGLWPHILMVDVVDDGDDYFVRLFGQRLVDTYGEQTGRKLSDAKVPDLVRDRSRRLFDFCLANGAPTYAYWSEMTSKRRRFFDVEALCLPLSGDGTTLDRMLSLNVNSLRES
jgi:hypothetical protein